MWSILWNVPWVLGNKLHSAAVETRINSVRFRSSGVWRTEREKHGNLTASYTGL